MPSLTRLFTFAALAITGFAASVPNAVRAHCSGFKLVSSAVVHVNGHDVVHTTHSCDVVNARQSSPSVDAVNVCGTGCTTSCNNVTGILPPISDDCDTIEDAVVILSSTMSPSFTVSPSHVETLTFGTCSYFFENLGHSSLTSCWADMSSKGDAAGAACFPPHQPFSPQGLCSSYDGSWAIGATHS